MEWQEISWTYSAHPPNQRTLYHEHSEFPFSEPAIANTNVCYTTKKSDHSYLIPSVREKGVLQSRLVRKNGKGYEVVAGGRRFMTLKLLKSEGQERETIPCIVVKKGDDAAAIEDSLIENVARWPTVEMALTSC